MPLPNDPSKHSREYYLRLLRTKENEHENSFGVRRHISNLNLFFLSSFISLPSRRGWLVIIISLVYISRTFNSISDTSHVASIKSSFSSFVFHAFYYTKQRLFPMMIGENSNCGCSLVSGSLSRKKSKELLFSPYFITDNFKYIFQRKYLNLKNHLDEKPLKKYFFLLFKKAHEANCSRCSLLPQRRFL